MKNWTCKSLAALMAFQSLVVPSSAMTQDGAEEMLFGDIAVVVTSVSKKEESFISAPAALYVINQEEIRRSGHQSLPELLRVVPGMHVAQVNTNNWAVSVRGANGRDNARLLPLIDGRSIFTPLFAGVYWDENEVYMEDLDRVEVIRGPGGTLWGSNAIAGVINVRTKSAKDTQGLYMEGGSGNLVAFGNGRYGGKAGRFYYRVYGKTSSYRPGMDNSGNRTPDGWRGRQGGFRTDWEPGPNDTVTVQGDYYGRAVDWQYDVLTRTSPFSRTVRETPGNFGRNVLGRWTHKFSAYSNLQVQSYYDRSARNLTLVEQRNSVVDFDVQHSFRLGERNSTVWGGNFHQTKYDFRNSYAFRMYPAVGKNDNYGGFFQNETEAVKDFLKVIVGAKVERNPYTRTEVEPSARLVVTPTSKSAFWAAASRVARAPAICEENTMILAQNLNPFPPPFMAVGVIAARTQIPETVDAYEAGYRMQARSDLFFDLSAFYNRHFDLIDVDLSVIGATPVIAPDGVRVFPITWGNVGGGKDYGGELNVKWMPAPNWSMSAGYTRQKATEDYGVKIISGDRNIPPPLNQFSLRSYLNVGPKVELNTAVYYYDHLNYNKLPVTRHFIVPAFMRVDQGISYAPSKNLEISVWGQNLLDPRHVEFPNTVAFVTTTQTPRSVYGKVAVKFQ